MSLLMDALRKADQAKRRAESGLASAGSHRNDGELSLEPLAPTKSEGALPELPEKLEELDDQFAHVPTRPAAGSRAVESAAPPSPSPASASLDEERNRAAARNLFEVKQDTAEQSPLLYMILGLALLCAVGIGAYFWLQLRSASSSGLGATPELEARTALPPIKPQVEPPQPPAPAVSSPSAPPVGQSTMPSPASRSEPVPSTEPPRTVRGRFADEEPAAAAEIVRQPRIRLSQSTERIPAGVSVAYRAFEQGDLNTARREYEAVLRSEPRNVDALLGLGAIAVRQGQPDTASAYYQRVLEADPLEPNAQTALAYLSSQNSPTQAETRLKSVTTKAPDSASAHFALGNHYARQGKWNDAQQAYFKAYSLEPDNPDYLFNLAVSLDQLRQPRLALQYYRSALASARQRPASFDPAQVNTRVRELNEPE